MFNPPIGRKLPEASAVTGYPVCYEQHLNVMPRITISKGKQLEQTTTLFHSLPPGSF